MTNHYMRPFTAQDAFISYCDKSVTLLLYFTESDTFSKGRVTNISFAGDKLYSVNLLTGEDEEAWYFPQYVMVCYTAAWIGEPTIDPAYANGARIAAAFAADREVNPGKYVATAEVPNEDEVEAMRLRKKALIEETPQFRIGGMPATDAGNPFPSPLTAAEKSGDTAFFAPQTANSIWPSLYAIGQRVRYNGKHNGLQGRIGTVKGVNGSVYTLDMGTGVEIVDAMESELNATSVPPEGEVPGTHFQHGTGE